MFAKTCVLSATFLVLATLAPNAAADGFGIAFGKHGASVSLGFQFGAPTCVVQPAPCGASVWVPGHYETVLETVRASGRVFDVVVSAGHWKWTCVPAHDEARRVSVWQPAHWEARY